MTSESIANRFETLTFERRVAAPLATLWQAWTSPVARAVWAAPSPNFAVEFIETSTSVGGREVSLCKVAGCPDVRAEVRWLHLDPARCSVNSEVISSQGEIEGAALVTARFEADGDASRLLLTVQLSAFAEGMADGFRHGYGAGTANLAGVAERTMLLTRVIKAPVKTVWNAWWNPENLPKWWGPDGFSCRTTRINLVPGGEWVFDMIAPDGTVFPNHHRYVEALPQQRLSYTLHWGENGPKHADAWAMFDEVEGGTQVTLGMIFATAAEFQNAKGFGAEALGLQTLGKLAKSIGAE